MILTLMGSALGFLGSAVPRIFDMVDEWQDRKHEVEMVKLNMEAAKVQHSLRLEEINAKADIAQSKAIYKHDSSIQTKPGGFINALRGSVRPVVTYIFLAWFVSVKAFALYALVCLEGLMIAQAMPIIYDEGSAALFSCIIAFWFGSRVLNKASK